MKLSEQSKTGQELMDERRDLLYRMHLGLSETEQQRLSELDDLIGQLPLNDSPDNRKLVEQVKSLYSTVKTDCRSDVGIAVGLVDSIITSARVLRRMGPEFLNLHAEIQEALKDLKQDEDVEFLLKD